MDKLLLEKQDELDEYQEKLRLAEGQIEKLQSENKNMAFDLDKAELMLDEYYEKIQE